MEESEFLRLDVASYDEIRDSIQDGDVLVTSGERFFAKVIRQASQSMFSHAGLVFWARGRVLVLESFAQDGVRAVNLSSYIKDFENTGRPYNGKVYLMRRKENFQRNELDTIVNFGLNQLNRNYDKDAIVKITWRLMNGEVRNESDNEYFCSELVSECFKQVGFNFESISDFVLPCHIARDERLAVTSRIL